VRSTLLGVVALALFAAAVAVTGIFLAGGFRGGIPVDAVFSAPGIGQQLPVGGDVKIRGVLVGHISGIDLTEDGNAVIELSLNGDDDVPIDASAEIRSKTVFGEKWVELIPPAGSDEGPFLRSGDVIPDERTKEPLEFERALQLGHDLLSAIPPGDLARALEALAEGFAGQEASGRTAIDRGLVALRAVNSRAGELDLSLRQLREFSEWLDENDSDLVSFMESLDSANRALVGAAPAFRSNLQSVPAFFDSLASFQERVEDDLGRLVEDGATVSEIVAARADNLTDIVVQLRAFTTVWNSGLSQPCGGVFESGLTCWQLYQLPGLDSRGLYGPGQAPDADEIGDPLRGVAGEATVFDSEIANLIDEALHRGGAAEILVAALRGEGR